MERICKEAGFGLNLPVTLGIAEITGTVEEDLGEVVEVIEEETEAEEAGLEETHLDPEPITDWLWKICLHVLHGRI